MDAQKGVIIEFDFAVLSGGELLFETARRMLKELDSLAFDSATEANFLAGRDYLTGLSAYFSAVKTKKTAARAAKILQEEFVREVSGAIGSAVTTPFRNFVKALVEREVKVSIATRADPASAAAAFKDLLSDEVVVFNEQSDVYGALRWESWRRAVAEAKLLPRNTLAVTGSGFGVRAALRASMGSVAVMTDRVAYQDFTGADAIVDELSGKTAKTVLSALRLG